jgi:hypothetical protein
MLENVTDDAELLKVVVAIVLYVAPAATLCSLYSVEGEV